MGSLVLVHFLGCLSYSKKGQSQHALTFDSSFFFPTLPPWSNTGQLPSYPARGPAPVPDWLLKVSSFSQIAGTLGGTRA